MGLVWARRGGTRHGQVRGQRRVRRLAFSLLNTCPSTISHTMVRQNYLLFQGVFQRWTYPDLHFSSVTFPQSLEDYKSLIV